MNKIVKCAIAMVAAVLAVSSFAQEPAETKYMPLAEARSTISEAVKDPEVMTETMRQLSPEDQVIYVAEVNAAIAKMPGSAEERTAAALNANKAALRSAAPGNVANVLAEVYATAPVESLGVISENFGKDLFNREADQAHPYSDAQFTAIAEAVVKKIADRTANSDDGGVRSAFGMMMMVSASNGSIDNLSDTLIESLPVEVREVAKNEWVPAATGEDKSYESMIAYSTEATTTTSEPSATLSLQLAGPQMLDAMLSDVAAGILVNSESATPILDQSFGGFGENVVNNTTTAGGTTISDTTETAKQPDPEEPWNPVNPGPYPWAD